MLLGAQAAAPDMVREGFKKKNVESVSMLIPPPPPTVSALGYFFCDVFWIIGVVWYAVKQILYHF